MQWLIICTDQHMPEGPTLYILKEETAHFKGKVIRHAWGNGPVDFEGLQGKKILDIRTWGKQYFLILKDRIIRIHFLLFGSYHLNEHIRPDRSLRLALEFSRGSIYFYTCAIQTLEGSLVDHYDLKADIMSKAWDPAVAKRKLKALSDVPVCDALLDQQIFSGSGNIIKNEVLYRTKIHPEALVQDLPAARLTALINGVVRYAFEFLQWKREGTLAEHWEAYAQKLCHRCRLPFSKKKTGKTNRPTRFCENCQLRYD